MKKALLAALVLIILAVLGLPPVFGMLAERRIQEEVAKAADLNYTVDVQIESYERGWFSSNARLALRFSDEYVEGLRAALADLQQQTAGDGAVPGKGGVAPVLKFLEATLPLDATIEHGPVGFGDGLFLGLYRTETLSALELPELDKALTAAGMDYFWKARTRTGFTGDTRYEIVMPPGQMADENGEMQFSGLNLTGAFSIADERLDVEMAGEMDYFTLAAKEVEVAVNGLSLAADIRTFSPYIWTGPVQMAIRQISFSGKGANLGVAIIDGFRVQAQTQLDDSESTVSLAGSYELDNFSLDGVTRLSDFKLDMALKQLDREALEAYVALAQTLDPGADADAMAMLAQIQEVVHPLLAKSPSLVVAPVSFVTGDGPVDAGVTLRTLGERLPPADQFSFFDIGLWQALFELDLVIDMGDVLAQNLATRMIRGQIQQSLPEGAEVSAEQLDGMAQMQGPQMLLALVQQGLIEKGGHGYRTKVQYAAGTLKVNGAEIPLGALLGGLGGSQ